MLDSVFTVFLPKTSFYKILRDWKTIIISLKIRNYVEKEAIINREVILSKETKTKTFKNREYLKK